ncbi:MAG: glycosyltransferase [Pseudomonadota bacterium]
MKKLKKVIFVLPSLRGGGAERVNLTIINNLDKTKFEITLFVFTSNDCKYYDKIAPHIKVIFACNRKSLTFILPRIIKKLNFSIKKNDIVVAGLELLATYTCYVASLFSGVKVISWMHCNINEYLVIDGRSKIHIGLIKLIYPKLSTIVCITEGAKKSLNKILKPINKSNCIIINNPIEVNSGVDASLSRIEPDFFNDSNKEYLIVSAGTLNYRKGFDLLIKAMASLIDDGVAVRLIIYGDGPEKKNLNDLIIKLGIVEYIELYGFVEDLICMISKADLYVLPSRAEGFGMVILEAMLAGVPVLAADCPTGPREILGDNEYGVLVKCSDIASMKDGIKMLLESKSLRQEYVKKASERVLHYNVGDVLEKWEALLLE